MKFKEKLIESLGFVGMILYYIASAVIYVMPIVMLSLPFWIDAILIAVMMFVPLGQPIVWIIGLVATIAGVQDVFSIIYYILFAVLITPEIVGFVLGFMKD